MLLVFGVLMEFFRSFLLPHFFIFKKRVFTMPTFSSVINPVWTWLMMYLFRITRYHFSISWQIEKVSILKCVDYFFNLNFSNIYMVIHHYFIDLCYTYYNIIIKHNILSNIKLKNDTNVSCSIMFFLWQLAELNLLKMTVSKVKKFIV